LPRDEQLPPKLLSRRDEELRPYSIQPREGQLLSTQPVEENGDYNSAHPSDDPLLFNKGGGGFHYNSFGCSLVKI
jgi:hypothetical protein